MFPFALDHAPAHVEETRPGQDAQRQAETPDRQVFEGIQVCAPRPLQVPGQVGVTARLDALLGNIRQPLLAGQDAVEGVRLENAEGDESG